MKRFVRRRIRRNKETIDHRGNLVLKDRQSLAAVEVQQQQDLAEHVRIPEVGRTVDVLRV